MVLQPAMIQKNHKKNSIDNPDIYELYRNTYLLLPVKARTRFLKLRKIEFFVDGGVFSGYWLNGNENGQLPDLLSSFGQFEAESSEHFRIVKFSVNKKFSSAQDNRFEAGLTFGGGGSVNWGRKIISLELYALRSLTSTIKTLDKNQPGQFNRSINFQLTYAYRL
jgi:hypothetical protein